MLEAGMLFFTLSVQWPVLMWPGLMTTARYEYLHSTAHEINADITRAGVLSMVHCVKSLLPDQCWPINRKSVPHPSTDRAHSQIRNPNSEFRIWSAVNSDSVEKVDSTHP
jgi:hypothetical protein